MLPSFPRLGFHVLSLTVLRFLHLFAISTFLYAYLAYPFSSASESTEAFFLVNELRIADTHLQVVQSTRMQNRFHPHLFLFACTVPPFLQRILDNIRRYLSLSYRIFVIVDVEEANG